MAKEDLIPVTTHEEAVERGRAGGKKSGESRRAKKSMKDTAKYLMGMKVQGANQENLERFGIEKDDQNYQTAMIVRLIQKGLVEGDVSSVRLLAELTGDIQKNGVGNVIDLDGGEMLYPVINIPANGRDPVPEFRIAPQPGPQTEFMTSKADIIIYGGAAGGGKSYAILMEMLRHKDVPGFNAAIFRSSYTQVTNPGGLWDSSVELFDQVEGAVSGKTPKLHWDFSGKSRLTFAHITMERDLKDWQGSQIAYIAFDELTHFSKHQFFYMLTRNRSMCGVRPYMRATCNPDCDSWVADFIKWWINQDTGYADEERAGKIRYLFVYQEEAYWADTKEELIERFKDYDASEETVKSVTFIPSKLDDNQILMKKDPTYRANLMAQNEVDRERLLNGNWKIKPAAGSYFKRVQVTMLDVLPNDITAYVRAWDLAATSSDENGEADFTAGVLMGYRKCGRFVIINAIKEQIQAGDVEKLIKNTSAIDRGKYGFMYSVHIPQDPGAAGKILAQQMVKMLAGYNVKAEGISGSKEVRAKPLSAQWQNGNVDVMVGDWNEWYFNEMESFPESKHDDLVDATSDAFNMLTSDGFDIDSLL